MTDHHMTEGRAAELWDEHIPERKAHYLGWRTFPGPSRRCFTTIIRAVFDAGREYERATNPEDDRPWEPLNVDDPLHAGDEVRRDHLGLTATATVARVDGTGEPRTDWGALIGLRCYGTWYVRRATQKVALPSRHPAHLLDVEQEDGDTCRYMALDRDGNWVGVDQDGELRTTTPDGIAECTLPAGTRLRRAGNHDDGTPRFVKEDA